MTSVITFDPPLGAVEHIHGGSHSHLRILQGPQPLSIDFLFTAQLSSYNYENLVVRDGARLQIWTNIPRLEDEDGNDQAWREIEFVDPEATSREISAYMKVFLHVSSEKERRQQTENDTHTVYAAIPIPSARTREFSYTYRVVYPSGRTTWLGFYERNGAIIVHADRAFSGPFSSRTIDYAENLSLKGSWSAYSSSSVAGFTINAENAEGLQVAQVSNMAITRIWALGKDRLLRHASMLVLVPAPKSQPLQDKIMYRPSSILSASPGATLSISENGGVTVSGSGTVQMTITNCLQQYSPGVIVEAAIKHSDLSGNWALLANDTRSRTVILACTGNGLPIPAVVVSFGTLWSNFTQGPTSVSVETSKLAALLNNPGATGKALKEFAIFSASRGAMHVFNVEEETAKPGHIVIEVNSSHHQFTEAHTFTVAPLYRLHTHKHLGTASSKLGRNWAAAILTSYRIVPPSSSASANIATASATPTDSGNITDARGLLTPPPSPPPPPGFSVQAQNSESSPFRLSRTSLMLGNISKSPDDIIPVNYAVRRRSVASIATTKPATTELKHLNVEPLVNASFRKAPSRRHSPVDKPTVASSKRAAPKPQRFSCPMWIFRIVFKCLFASVRVFLRVVFNVRFTLAWGVGLVIRGPGFAWGLLWGARARPSRLPKLQSLNAVASVNQMAGESSHRQRSLSSSRSSGIQLSSTKNDNRANTNSISDSRHGGDTSTYSVSHSHSTYQETAIHLETMPQLKEPLSSRRSERPGYPNEFETSSAMEYNDSEETSIIHAHHIAVADPVIRNSDPRHTAWSPVTLCSKMPLLQSELETLKDLENDGGFYAEITPLCSNGTEMVEMVLFALPSTDARNSERDAQHDATNARISNFDATLLERAVNFIPSRNSRAGPSEPSVDLKKNTHPLVDIRPMGVHIMHLPAPPGSKTPDALTASSSSIPDLSAATDAVLDLEYPGNTRPSRQETLDTQYSASAFVIRYQLAQETLDHEAGTVVVAVDSPEPCLFKHDRGFQNLNNA